MTPRRELVLGVLVTASGGAVLALAASRPLASGPQLPGTASGTVGGPAATAVGVLGLAAAVALLAVRGWSRVAVGAVTAAAGVLVLVVGGREGDGAGSWLVAAGAVLLALGGALTAVRGRRWPGLSGRYERDAAGGSPRRPADDDRSLWDALDRGEDPTDGSR